MESRYSTTKVSLNNCCARCRPTSSNSGGFGGEPGPRYSDPYSLNITPQFRLAYASGCPSCDNKPQCGRHRSRSEGLEADPLREYNGSYETVKEFQSFPKGLLKADLVNKSSSTSLPSNFSFPKSLYHLSESGRPKSANIGRSMETSPKAFNLSPSKNSRERLLPNHPGHQQRTYEESGINIAQNLSHSGMDQNSKLAHQLYDNGFPDKCQRVITGNSKHERAAHISSNQNFQSNGFKNGNFGTEQECLSDSMQQCISKDGSPMARKCRGGRAYIGSFDEKIENKIKSLENSSRHSNHVTTSTIEDRYQFEVEVLRSRLLELRGAEGKRIRQRSESEPSVDVTCNGSQNHSRDPKRARDISPHNWQPDNCVDDNKSSNGNKCITYRPSGQRARLPSLPSKPNGSLPCVSVLEHSPSLTKGGPDSPSLYSSFVSEDDEQDCCEDLQDQEDHEEDSEEDNLSVKSSLTTVSSSGSNASSRMRASIGSISLNDKAAPTPSVIPQFPKLPKNIPSALRLSLFSYVPPYINFTLHDAPKWDSLPVEIHRLLKWKLSPITPLVVRRTLVNTGFRLVRKSNDWTGTWGKHMKSVCFKTLKDFQKINHFPGTFQIGRKDRLWKNLHHLMLKFGKKEFGFIPRTYVLPQDTKLLRQVWEKSSGTERWIIKPPASARGTGIKVVHRWNQIPKKRPLVVQKYIAQPYLINGSKFDLRLYVLVTSINPLRIYMYDDGLVRFASVKYSEDPASLSDRFMHLTNYSINKLSSQYTANEDSTACKGHKWTVKSLWSYLREDGVDVDALWGRLVDLSIKTLISGESAISLLTRSNLSSRYSSYELFGIDVLLDVNLKPWLLEVNISPSLHSASPLDLVVKGPMVRDLLNMAGFQIPSKMPRAQQDTYLHAFGLRANTGHLCFDKRLYTMVLSKAERTKHMTHQQTSSRKEYLEQILADLTPDDVRHLIQGEDELSQAGNFKCIFPTTETHTYHDFFETPRYYNMLLDAWETKYHANRQEGINLLEAKCQKKFHLTIPVPGGLAKSYASQSSLGDSSNGWEDEHEEKPTPDRKIFTMATMALSGLARQRNCKYGLGGRPYSRSVYLTRKPKSSTLPTSMAKSSSLDLDVIASADHDKADEDR